MVLLDPGDPQEVVVCGNQAHNATGSHTWSHDAPDAQDANLTLLASGWNTDAPDVPKIFAD